MLSLVEPAGPLPAILMVGAAVFVWLRRERLHRGHVLRLLLGAMLLYASVALPLVYNFMVSPGRRLPPDVMTFAMTTFATLGMLCAFAMSVVLVLLASGLAGRPRD